MEQWPAVLADWIAASTANELATTALRGVPGLPPILQTVHLLGASVLMGSAVVLLMRVNGWLLRPWALPVLARNLLPWATGALVAMPLAMLPLLLARPHRYLHNPVFGIKMGLLLTALVLTIVVYRRVRMLKPGQTPSFACRLAAIPATLSWLSVLLAGRWIAYSDYLFWPA